MLKTINAICYSTSSFFCLEDINSSKKGISRSGIGKHIVLLLCVLFPAFTAFCGVPVKGGKKALPVSLSFRKNEGQVTDGRNHARPDIHFQLVAPGMSVFIGKGQLHYQFTENPATGGQTTEDITDRIEHAGKASFSTYRLDMELVGASAKAQVVTGQIAEDVMIRYIGNPMKKATAHSLKTYRKVTYRNIYPHIDWILYIDTAAETQEERLKYDFVVRPGGKVSDIKIRYGGATGLQQTPSGSIVLQTPMGSVEEQRPVSYTAGNKKPVDSRFVVSGDIISFATGKYTGSLVIDPVLQWATYYGGYLEDDVFKISTDNKGNVYMCGYTWSTENIATAGSYQSNYGTGDNGVIGSTTAMLVKFNKAGVRQWATYFGIDASTAFYGLACDEEGYIYAAGGASSNYPEMTIATPGAYQTVFGGQSDGMLVKFNAAGGLEWSTFIGGTNTDMVNGVAVSKSGTPYIIGQTKSTTGIATPGSFKTVRGTITQSSFISGFSKTGALLWSTYFDGSGGFGLDKLNGIACDNKGNVCVAGSMRSNGLATDDSYQTTKTGTYGTIIAKFSASGTRLWSRYYGKGAGNGEGATAITVDTSNNIYITGRNISATPDAGITTPGAYQETSFSTNVDGELYYPEAAYLSKFNEAGMLLWGTYYGAKHAVRSNTVACDNIGHVYIAGQVNINSEAPQSQLTTPNGYQLNYGGDQADGFIARFDTSGKREWASYYGGSDADPNGSGRDNDEVISIICDTANVVYFAGGTHSANGIATPGSFQPAYTANPDGYGGDIYLGKFDDCFVVAHPTAINGNKTVCAGGTETYTLSPAIGCANSYTWELPSGWKGTSTGTSISVTAGEQGGVIRVKANGTYDTSQWKPVTIAIYPAAAPAQISFSNGVLSEDGTHTSWQWYLNDELIAGATGRTYLPVKNGNYKVIASDNAGCKAVSAFFNVALANEIFIPNVFSPNGDAKNDVLKVYGNRIASMEFSIFNQWGQKIFQTRDLSGSWDGNVNGKPQPAGVYIYMLKATLTTGEIVNRKGSVSLVK